MRLADFIRGNKEAILAEWEEFAGRIPAARDMSPLELRDHAAHILDAIALDLDTPQTPQQQHEKAQGRAPVIAGAPETAAQTHAVLRRRDGFDINQLVSEYRALRASVLRLWEEGNLGEPRHREDMVRFNEAIDQALAESVTFFSAQGERSRTLLMAMVGHDMRNPLNTISLTSQYLAHANAGAEVTAAAQLLGEGSARLAALLDDLVDFNRARLGLGFQVTPQRVDLAESLARELALLRCAHPRNAIEFEAEGDPTCVCDERRVRQVLSNLVSNAVKYGVADGPIRVRLTGVADCVNLEVTNVGRLEDSERLHELFEPFRRGDNAGPLHEPDSLGLGLFIAREIAEAHGGRISVHPHPAATVFAVSLPRDGLRKER